MKEYKKPFVEIVQISSDVIKTSVNRLEEDNDFSDANFVFQGNYSPMKRDGGRDRSNVNFALKENTL